VKIGYQTCLKLLRAGCRSVVATTRFPNAAALAYQQEPDFDTWKHQLHVIGLDLRDVTGIEAFCRFCKQQFEHTGGIDILINNACQTIRRPAQYYTPAVQKEQTIWNEQKDNNSNSDHKLLLQKCTQFENIRHRIHQNNKQTTTTPSPNLLTTNETTTNLYQDPIT